MEITITADDFGWSADSVRATIECLTGGIVTNASIMPGVPNTADSIEFAARHTDYCYGVHLALAGDGRERPVSDPDEIPSLVDRSGCLMPAAVIRKRALLNAIPPAEIKREIRAQLSLVAGAGIRVSYVDSHKHMHKIPMIRRVLSDVLDEFGIGRVRRAQNVFLGCAYDRPTYWVGWLASRQIRRRFRTTDLFYMPTDSRDGDWDRRLSSRISNGTLEIGMHPGLEDAWRRSEMDAASRFVEKVRGIHRIVDWQSIAP